MPGSVTQFADNGQGSPGGTDDPTGKARMPVVDLDVWVDDWQMQCCGDSFGVGDDVAWTGREADSEWLQRVFGPDSPVSVDAAEEHHGGVDDDCPVTVGTVASIDAVHCRYEVGPGPDGRGGRYPVPGSGRRHTVGSADGWAANLDVLRFVGYLVQLTAVCARRRM